MFNKKDTSQPVMVPMSREEVKAFADWCRMMENSVEQFDKCIFLHSFRSSRGYGHLHIIDPSEAMSILQEEVKAANDRANELRQQVHELTQKQKRRW